jgi:hypothetical protein
MEHHLLPLKLPKELMTGLLPVKLNLPGSGTRARGYKTDNEVATEAIKRD